MNLFLKKLDRSWGVNDLHDIFKDYGEIKSAKISLNPTTHKSNGYGFVWFKQPSAAAKVLEDAEKSSFPFVIEPYKPRLASISKDGVRTGNAKVGNILVISGFDDTVTEDEI